MVDLLKPSSCCPGACTAALCPGLPLILKAWPPLSPHLRQDLRFCIRGCPALETGSGRSLGVRLRPAAMPPPAASVELCLVCTGWTSWGVSCLAHILWAPETQGLFRSADRWPACLQPGRGPEERPPLWAGLAPGLADPSCPLLSLSDRRHLPSDQCCDYSGRAKAAPELCKQERAPPFTASHF